MCMGICGIRSYLFKRNALFEQSKFSQDNLNKYQTLTINSISIPQSVISHEECAVFANHAVLRVQKFVEVVPHT